MGGGLSEAYVHGFNLINEGVRGEMPLDAVETPRHTLTFRRRRPVVPVSDAQVRQRTGLRSPVRSDPTHRIHLGE